MYKYIKRYFMQVFICSWYDGSTPDKIEATDRFTIDQDNLSIYLPSPFGKMPLSSKGKVYCKYSESTDTCTNYVWAFDREKVYTAVCDQVNAYIKGQHEQLDHMAEYMSKWR